MDIKSNLQLLSEAAAFETKANKATELKYERVREAYAAIPEVIEPAVTEAADVIVNAIGNDYYVEMVNLAPFMMDSGIKNIGEALDLVASANELPAKSVGIVVESQAYVDSMLKKAYSNAKARGNNKIFENALSKLNSNNVVIARLMHEGYKVVKKSPASKVCSKCGKVKCGCTEAAGDVCPKCGKKSCECECGDGSCSTPSNSSSLSEDAITFDQLCEQCDIGLLNELKGDFWQYGGVDHLNHGYEIKGAIRKVEKDPRFLDYLGHGLNVYANAQRMNDYNHRAKDTGSAYDTYMSYKAAQQFDQSIQNAPGSKTAKIEAYKNLLHTIDVNIERWRAEAHRNHGQNMRNHANHMVEELKRQRENVHNRLVYLRAEV